MITAAPTKGHRTDGTAASAALPNTLAPDPGAVPPVRLVGRILRFELQEQLRRAKRRLGLLKLRELTPDSHRVPDTALAKSALELATRISSPMLLNHVLRTYHFGAILAARDGLSLDRELLYVASVLHDIGLTPDFEAAPGSFEWVSAREGRAFGLDQGMSEERANLLHDAIALHSSAGVAGSREPEVAMVHYGAGADLLGVRFDEIPKLEIEDILERHPRCGFKRGFETCLHRQAELKPKSHIAGALRIGLDKRARAAPFDE